MSDNDSQSTEKDSVRNTIDDAMRRELKLRMDLLREISMETVARWWDKESFVRYVEERANAINLDLSEGKINVLWLEIQSQLERNKLHKMGIYEQSLKHSEELEILRHQATLDDIFGQIDNARNRRQLRSRTTILFLAADPTDASRLRLGEEFREIDEQLALAELRECFSLALPQLSLRSKDIARALLNTQPQIVHFSGHGTPNGAVCFENEIGERQDVQPDALAALFEQFADQVNCVVLNACYSDVQARAIAKHINYVIGMNTEIGDKAAIAFALGFYQALGAARTIEDAYKLGCVQIRLQGISEHLTPVLIKKRQQAAA